MTLKLLSTLALSLAVSFAAAFPDGCKSYSAPSSSVSESSPLLSSILVGDAFHLGAVYLSDLSLSSTSQVEALKISLSAVTPKLDPVTITLKSTGEGGTATSLSGVIFDDAASASFPDGLEAPPPPLISGSFFPCQDLSTFVNSSSSSTDAGEGGSHGSWVLRIVDLSETPSAGTLNLSSWSLILCPANVVITPPIDATSPQVSSLSGQADNTTSLSLLENILNRIDRNVSSTDPLSVLNNTLARDWSSYQGNVSNASAFQRIENRLNKLLTGYSTNATSGSLLGSFRMGNETLPSGPTARLLDALRTVINDLEGSNTSAAGNSILTRSSTPGVSSASGPSDAAGSSLLNLKSSLLSGSMLKSLASSLTGLSSSGNYLQQAMQFVQSIEAKVSSSPLVSTAKAGLQSIESLASQSIQSKINLFSSQSSLLKSQLQTKISSYENAVQLSSSLISQAIQQHSQSALKHAQSIKAKATNLKGELSNTTASKLIRSKLSSISQSAHAIGNIGKTLSGDVTSLIQQLAQLYKSQLSGVSDIASAKTSARLTQAQSLADASISALISVVDKINTALDQWSSGAGPLAGKDIKLYESGLSFLNTGLQAVKARIVSAPTQIDYSTLLSNLKSSKVSALSGPSSGGILSTAAADVKQEVQKFYSSLGSGATGALNTQLVGKINQFDAKVKSLFPKLASTVQGKM